LTHQLIFVIGQYGLLIVVVNVFLDQIGLPIPALPTLVVAGACAADGQMPLLAGAAPVIVDVRSITARALEPRWIPGALHVPLQDVASHLAWVAAGHEVATT
jgi:hypothetical protein